MDAVFFWKKDCARTTNKSFADSAEAENILTSLSNTIDEGHSENLVQVVPHFGLINLPFYHKKMKPLLARWMMLWLATKHAIGASESDIMEYLLRGTTGEKTKISNY